MQPCHMSVTTEPCARRNWQKTARPLNPHISLDTRQGGGYTFSVLAHLFSLALALVVGHCLWRGITAAVPVERAIAFAEAAGVFVVLVLLFVYGRP